QSMAIFCFSSRRRHTRCYRDWSSDVCSSDLLPQRRRRREAQDLLTKLSPGDEVVTASGIYGTVTEIEDGGTILLEVAENTDIRRSEERRVGKESRRGGTRCEKESENGV